MSRILPASQFRSRDTVRLARSLIGKKLVATLPDGVRSCLAITETEAYDGPEDLACHASKGRTTRTEVMFGPAGRWYVYLVYGMHEMLNLVTGPEGYPAAILIRGVEGLSGPGRLTKALGIDRRFNAQPASPATGLHLEDATPAPDGEVIATPRIGVAYAGPDWSQRPYRFVLKSAKPIRKRPR
ncbi:DNA-3-methyladenine glycosylase [Pelagicoccus sp. SDUM812003]|uniref:DNA-3-methyladenine glycosylase n=1 Tax=Pelagicoccus sp. SDUM812003 TaxID=3041267 RepID=UPI00280CDCB9|nr:DNA-3-methyladenine glycosylase [Pelagicoccus sp. SDUM812003]MDQ8202394.1 DNA-3-methyladenine glycosylase [Pelagicoccus sp. SDUM812003]